MKALVYRSTGSWYDVTDETGKRWKARIKGVMRTDGITSTNPIAVGDWVDIEPEDEAGSIATIVTIFDRSNYISRQSPGHKNKHHIVASNLCQSMLICTLKDPRTSQGFIDRFLAASEAYHVPAIIIFNKNDTWAKKEEQQYNQWKLMYERIGYIVESISVQNRDGMQTVKELLADKTTLLSGHSGVGKSSFLNAIAPALDLRTKAVSGWSGKGMHTTTFAEMFDLPEGGKVIDTPGVREFGLVHISRQELSHYFPEMRALLNKCQFNNCLHINEPGCAVRPSILDDIDDVLQHGLPSDVIQTGVTIERYMSYRAILESID